MQKKAVLLPLLLVFLSGCLSATPFQSARVVEEDESSLTLSVLHSTVDNGYGHSGWTNLEVAARNPIVGGKLEFPLNGGLLVFNGPSFGGMLGAGLKAELLENILAFEVPARIMIGASNPVETTHFSPRLIASVPLSETLEFNLSATRFYYTEGGIDGPAGYAAGFAYGKRGDSIFRTEFGVLIYPHHDDITYQIGIGISPGFKKREPVSRLESTPY